MIFLEQPITSELASQDLTVLDISTDRAHALHFNMTKLSLRNR